MFSMENLHRKHFLIQDIMKYIDLHNRLKEVVNYESPEIIIDEKTVVQNFDFESKYSSLIIREDQENYKAFIEYFLLVIINITISGLLVTKVYNYIHLNATFIKVIIDSIIFIINYFLQKLVIFKK